MKKSRLSLGLASLAVVLILTAGIGSAWSYFTTYAEAKGGYTIHLGDEQRITETFSNWTKHISISNDADSTTPVFIRVNAYCANYELTFTDTEGKWSLGEDGFYYYADPVDPGKETEVLDIHIDHVPSNVTDGDTFNVVVVYESTPVLTNEDGTLYADWDNVVDTGSQGGEE